MGRERPVAGRGPPLPPPPPDFLIRWSGGAGTVIFLSEPTHCCWGVGEGEAEGRQDPTSFLDPWLGVVVVAGAVGLLTDECWLELVSWGQPLPGPATSLDGDGPGQPPSDSDEDLNKNKQSDGDQPMRYHGNGDLSVIYCHGTNIVSLSLPSLIAPYRGLGVKDAYKKHIGFKGVFRGRGRSHNTSQSYYLQYPLLANSSAPLRNFIEYAPD